MFRPAARALARAPAVAGRGPARARLISTGPAPKSRSWKNTAVRLGLAAGAVYYYNTSSVFAQEPSFSLLSKSQLDSTEESSTQTLDSITPKIRQERVPHSQPKPAPPSSHADELEGGMDAQALEEEAGQEAAFNPETGEINWDCPCLGGMAHGPCGEEFKAAFSCFVYSEEEPKGMDCIEKFQGMQNCFRAHPDVYGAELEEDEEEAEGAPAPAPDAGRSEQQPPATELDASSHPDEKRAHAKEVRDQMKAEVAEKGEHPEADTLLPKASHDAEEKNQATQKTEK